MGQHRNKLYATLTYVQEKHKDIKIQQDAVGLVEENQWIALASHKEIEDRLLVVVDMNTPRKIVLLPINDTIAYFIAKNILAYHNEALRYALQCAAEIERQNKNQINH